MSRSKKQREELRLRNLPLIKESLRYSQWANQNENKTENDKKLRDYCIKNNIKYKYRIPYYIKSKDGVIHQVLLFPFIFVKKRIAIRFEDSPIYQMVKTSVPVTKELEKACLNHNGRRVYTLKSFNEDLLNKIFKEHDI